MLYKSQEVKEKDLKNALKRGVKGILGVYTALSILGSIILASPALGSKYKKENGDNLKHQYERGRYCISLPQKGNLDGSIVCYDYIKVKGNKGNKDKYYIETTVIIPFEKRIPMTALYDLDYNGKFDNCEVYGIDETMCNTLYKLLQTDIILRKSEKPDEKKKNLEKNDEKKYLI